MMTSNNSDNISVVNKPEQDSWDHSIKLLFKGNELVFTNKFDEAEALYMDGLQHDPTEMDGDYDLRAVFGLLHAMLAASKGIASLSNDQLAECLERLKSAERLTRFDRDWIGKKGVKGICILAIGLIELLEQTFLKGIYNVMRSWNHIKVLRTQGIYYEGREAPIVRSFALFAVASFYLLYGFLPPTAMKIATFVSGFEGDRAKGLDMLKQCWEEGGICAPWAALSWLSYYTDTITFIGEPLDEVTKNSCKEMLKWADSNYPNSIFFSITKVDFASYNRDNELAKRITEENAPNFVLPGLKWVLNYKRGVFLWNERSWFKAAETFETSMQVYIEGNRRSMVPYMAAFSLLSYLQAHRVDIVCKDKALNKAREMVGILEKYKSMKKRNWGRQDLFGFRLFKMFKDLDQSERWVLLELAQIMVLQVRNCWWMSMDQLSALQKDLQHEFEDREKNGKITDDDRADYYLCLTEIESQKGDKDKALEIAGKAIDLEPKLSRSGRKKGTIPMVLYMCAHIYYLRGETDKAKAFLKRVRSYAIVLAQNLGERFVSDYIEVKVAARSSESVTFNIGNNNSSPIEWTWYVEKFTIRFRAEFIPTSNSEPVIIQTISKSDSEGKEVLGEFHPNQSGTLRLTWINDFSLIRGKSVFYKISGNFLNKDEGDE